MSDDKLDDNYYRFLAHGYFPPDPPRRCPRCDTDLPADGRCHQCKRDERELEKQQEALDEHADYSEPMGGGDDE